MKKSLILLLALVLSVSIVFGGCSKNKGGITAETIDDKLLNDTIVGTIDKHKITHADYNFIYALVYNSIAQNYAQYPNWEEMEIEEGRTISDYIRETTKEQLKQMYATVDIAKKNGIKLNSKLKELAQKQKNDVIKQVYSDETGYKEYLTSAHTTDEAFTNYFNLCEVYNALFEKLTSKGGGLDVDEKKLKKDYLKENEGKWRVQHILISTQEETDEQGNVTKAARSEEDALKLANEVISKLDKGEDFDALIEEYDEDPGMEKGKYYLFGEGEMVPEFEEATKNLKIGKYSKEPVKSDFGYHIIKRYEISTDSEEYDSYRAQILQNKVIELIEEKMKKQKVSIDDTIIDNFFKQVEEAEKAAEAQYQKENFTVTTPDEKENAE